jgi:hypothetical protein
MLKSYYSYRKFKYVLILNCLFFKLYEIIANFQLTLGISGYGSIFGMRIRIQELV